MQLGYGSYLWPVNGVKVTSGRRVELDASETPFQYTDSIGADGYIEGAGQAALTTAENTMKAALMVPFKDLVLYQDSGAASATVLRALGSIRGPVLTGGPDFRDTMGPEYATQRHFNFQMEATYPYPGRFGNTITDWQETISIKGGGALYTVKPAIVGPPQRQKIYEVTPCFATQTGYAVGYLGYPTVPGPIWPFALKETRPELTEETPVKKGSATFIQYRISWSYTFAWVGPLVGAPTLWPIN